MAAAADHRALDNLELAAQPTWPFCTLVARVKTFSFHNAAISRTSI